MPGNVRQRMIAGALDLLSRHGLQSTSFAEVTQATHTPRGSIYHHFPGGKQELVLEALDACAARFRDFVATLPRDSTETMIVALFDGLSEALIATDFTTGSAVGAVTVAAENAEQLERCSAVYRGNVAALASALVECGAQPAAAEEFAAVVLSTASGATVIARAQRSISPVKAVRRTVEAEAAALPLAS